MAFYTINVAFTVEADDPSHASRCVVKALENVTEDPAIEDWEFVGQPAPFQD